MYGAILDDIIGSPYEFDECRKRIEPDMAEVLNRFEKTVMPRRPSGAAE